MKPKKTARAAENDESPDSSTTDKLLALLVLEAIAKKSDQDKAVLLESAGLKNADIAALLRTSAHTVRQHLYAARKAGPRKKASTRKPKTGKKRK
jgi:DNA-directed RNA polymerase specialized sigma24 family protein